MGTRIYLTDLRRIRDPLEVPQWRRILEPDRWEKICRCSSAVRRRQSAAAGWLLRVALEREGFHPGAGALPIKREGGKPVLENRCFNLSHGGRYVLCVLSEREAGCDIEKVRPYSPRFAKRWYTEPERRALCTLTKQAERDLWFTGMWTLREAYLKKTGEGLSVSPAALCFYRERGASGRQSVPGIRIGGTRDGQRLSERFWLSRVQDYVLSVCSAEPVDRLEFVANMTTDWS